MSRSVDAEGVLCGHQVLVSEPIGRQPFTESQGDARILSWIKQAIRHEKTDSAPSASTEGLQSSEILARRSYAFYELIQ